MDTFDYAELEEWRRHMLCKHRIGGALGALLLMLFEKTNYTEELRDFLRLFCSIFMQLAGESTEVNEKDVVGYLERLCLKNAIEHRKSPFLEMFISIHGLYKDYFGGREIPPLDFVSWAMDMEVLNVPQKLIEWKYAQEAKLCTGDEGAHDDEAIQIRIAEEDIPPLDLRQETTYKVLLGALLCHAGKYPWGERGGKVAAVKWLSRELEGLGCAISEKTIGKCLDGLPEAMRKKEIATISRK